MLQTRAEIVAERDEYLRLYQDEAIRHQATTQVVENLKRDITRLVAAAARQQAEIDELRAQLVLVAQNE